MRHVAIFALALIWSSPSLSISMRHDLLNEVTNPGSNAYSSIAKQSRFLPSGRLTIFGNHSDGVGVQYCSGTLISQNTVITAAHCLTGSRGSAFQVHFELPSSSVSGTIDLNKSLSEQPRTTLFSSGNWVIHPGFTELGATLPIFKPNPSTGILELIFGNELAINDIALIQVGNPEVTQPLPVASFYNGPVPTGAIMLIPGFGDIALGLNGVVVEDLLPGRRGRKLVAANRVDGAGSVVPDTIRWDFDDRAGVIADGFPASFNEGGVMPSDSGAGIYVTDPVLTLGQTLLAGVVSGYENAPTRLGQYGSSFAGSFLPSFQSWINENSFGEVVWAEQTGFSPNNPFMAIEKDGFKWFLGLPALSTIPTFFDPEVGEYTVFEQFTGPMFQRLSLPLLDSDKSYRIFSINDLGNLVYLDEVFGGAWFEFSSPLDRFVIGMEGGPLGNIVFGLQFDENGSTTFRMGEYRPSTAVIPEPRAWAMMIAGFGLVGGGLRVRRRLEARNAFAAS